MLRVNTNGNGKQKKRQISIYFQFSFTENKFTLNNTIQDYMYSLIKIPIRFSTRSVFGLILTEQKALYFVLTFGVTVVAIKFMAISPFAWLGENKDKMIQVWVDLGACNHPWIPLLTNARFM